SDLRKRSLIDHPGRPHGQFGGAARARPEDSRTMPTPPPTGPLVTRDTVAAQLRLLGVKTGEILLAHSSLSSLGWVNGGAVATPPWGAPLPAPPRPGPWPPRAGGGNPPVPEEWWDRTRAPMPAYDPLITPTRAVGVIPEAVRTWPGGRCAAPTRRPPSPPSAR